MHQLTIVGLGPGNEDYLTMQAMQVLHSRAKIFLRTEKHATVQWFRKERIFFETMDDLYENCEDFDELNRLICARIREALQTNDVIYAVPNAGDESDETVQALVREGFALRMIPGIAQETLLGQGVMRQGETVTDGRWQRVSAQDAMSLETDTRCPLMITELENVLVAGEVKIRLMEAYRDDHPVWFMTADSVKKIMLRDLDLQEGIDHRTCVLVPPVTSLDELDRFSFRDLEEVMRVIRGPGGCPWDRVQDHHSIEQDLLEEAYEARDALRREDIAASIEELGDLLLQIVFHAQIAEQYGEYDMTDITTEISEKMIHRHPHVFVDRNAAIDWEKEKNSEKGFSTVYQTMRDVPKTMPSLIRLQKLQKRTGLLNDASMTDEMLQKSGTAFLNGPSQNTAAEFLFWICNRARLKKANLEMMLIDLCEKMLEIYKEKEDRIGDADSLIGSLF